VNCGDVVLSNAKEGKSWRVLEPGTLEMLLENALSTTVHDATGKDVDFNVIFLEGKQFIFKSFEFFIFL
jgi:hypothetical protein